jgi:hypothetical protein
MGRRCELWCKSGSTGSPTLRSGPGQLVRAIDEATPHWRRLVAFWL